MNFAEVRARIRAVIFAITGFISAFLFLRIILDLISADSTNVLVSLINQITTPLISLFSNLVVLPQTGILALINTEAIIAFIVYILAAIAISEIITAFIYENFKDILQNIVDALFKVIEALLILRIVFDLFGIGLALTSPAFVKFIYTSTAWSQGILFDQTFLSGKINLSAIISLIIIVVIDLATERFLDSLYDRVTLFVKESKIALPKVRITNILPSAGKVKSSNSETTSQKAAQPIQQNIIINVPVPANTTKPTAPFVKVETSTPTSTVNKINDPHSPEIKEFKGPQQVKEG